MSDLLWLLAPLLYIAPHTKTVTQVLLELLLDTSPHTVTQVLFFYYNKPHTYTYGFTNQVHIQLCTSFNIVHHPEIKSAGSPFPNISSSSQPAALKSVQCSKLTGINKTNLQQGPRSKDDETDEESDCHKTVGSKSVSSHDPLQLTDS